MLQFVSSDEKGAYDVVEGGMEALKRQLSTEKLAEMVKAKREEKGLTQEELSGLTDIHRVTIGRIERQSFIPSIPQLEALSHALDFDMTQVFVEVPGNDSFIALRGEARTDTEQEGINRLFSMMLALRQQFLLRRKFDHEAHNSP
jgi:transcriptional regulator with XRE-family HTH domain